MGSEIVDVVTFDTTGFSNWNMGWTTYEYDVTATESITRLTFRSVIDGNYGPVLDAVSVTINQPSLLDLPFDPNDGQWTIVNGYRGYVDHALGGSPNNYALFAFDFAKCKPDKILAQEGKCDFSSGWDSATGSDVRSPVNGTIARITANDKKCAGFAISIENAPGYFIRLYHVDLAEQFKQGNIPVTQGLVIGSVSDKNCIKGGTGGHIHMVLYQQTDPKKDDPKTRIGIPFSIVVPYVDRWLIGECNFPDDGTTTNQYYGQLVPCNQ